MSILCLAVIFILTSCSEKTSTSQYGSIKLDHKVLGDRLITVWVPKSYHTTEDHYQVLYMHDGQMVFDPKRCWNGQSWEADSIAQRLIDEQLVDPFIIVGIDNQSETRYSDYCPKEPMGGLSQAAKESMSKVINGMDLSSDTYLSFLVLQVKPYVDKNYRTKKGSEHTAIMGSSMGGLISAYALCKYPDIFGKAACLSTHWPGPAIDHAEENAKLYIDYFANHLPDLKNKKLYFDLGTETLDSLYQPFQSSMDAALSSKGYVAGTDWKTMTFEGHDHSEVSWRKRLHIPLQYLFSKE